MNGNIPTSRDKMDSNGPVDPHLDPLVPKPKKCSQSQDCNGHDSVDNINGALSDIPQTHHVNESINGYCNAHLNSDSEDVGDANNVHDEIFVDDQALCLHDELCQCFVVSVNNNNHFAHKAECYRSHKRRTRSEGDSSEKQVTECGDVKKAGLLSTSASVNGKMLNGTHDASTDALQCNSDTDSTGSSCANDMENYLNANVEMLMFIEQHQMCMVQAYPPSFSVETTTAVSDLESTTSETSALDDVDSDLVSLGADSDPCELPHLVPEPDGRRDNGSDSGDVTGSESGLDDDGDDDDNDDDDDDGNDNELHGLLVPNNCDQESRENELNDQQEVHEAETRLSSRSGSEDLGDYIEADLSIAADSDDQTGMSRNQSPSGSFDNLSVRSIHNEDDSYAACAPLTKSCSLGDIATAENNNRIALSDPFLITSKELNMACAMSPTVGQEVFGSSDTNLPYQRTFDNAATHSLSDTDCSCNKWTNMSSSSMANAADVNGYRQCTSCIQNNIDNTIRQLNECTLSAATEEHLSSHLSNNIANNKRRLVDSKSCNTSFRSNTGMCSDHDSYPSAAIVVSETSGNTSTSSHSIPLEDAPAFVSHLQPEIPQQTVHQQQSIADEGAIFCNYMNSRRVGKSTSMNTASIESLPLQSTIPLVTTSVQSHSSQDGLHNAHLTRPFWPQFGDDDSPTCAVRLLDYFSQEAEFGERRLAEQASLSYNNCTPSHHSDPNICKTRDQQRSMINAYQQSCTNTSIQTTGDGCSHCHGTHRGTMNDMNMTRCHREAVVQTNRRQYNGSSTAALSGCSVSNIHGNHQHGTMPHVVSAVTTLPSFHHYTRTCGTHTCTAACTHVSDGSVKDDDGCGSAAIGPVEHSESQVDTSVADIMILNMMRDKEERTVRSKKTVTHEKSDKHALHYDANQQHPTCTHCHCAQQARLCHDERTDMSHHCTNNAYVAARRVDVQPVNTACMPSSVGVDSNARDGAACGRVCGACGNNRCIGGHINTGSVAGSNSITSQPHCQPPPTATSCECDTQKVMIWQEYDAYVLQVKQIGLSACGPTAIINVLKVFDVYVDKDIISSVIKTNVRNEGASVVQYLLSRSVAGTTAEQLINGVEEVTNGAVVGRFFCTYPARNINIIQWLGYWIQHGAVPLLTLNLQKAVPRGWTIPDAWHHQMVYGVGPKGVYMTNPLEVVPADVVMAQLTSDSSLLIRRNDILQRWHEHTDLSTLLTHPDSRWMQTNVLGQVVNVLREANLEQASPVIRPQLSSHISIPAWYKPGISLFVRANTPAHTLLLNAAQLPLYDKLPSPPSSPALPRAGHPSTNASQWLRRTVANSASDYGICSPGVVSEGGIAGARGVVEVPSYSCTSRRTQTLPKAKPVCTVDHCVANDSIASDVVAVEGLLHDPYMLPDALDDNEGDDDFEFEDVEDIDYDDNVAQLLSMQDTEETNPSSLEQLPVHADEHSNNMLGEETLYKLFDEVDIEVNETLDPSANSDTSNTLFHNNFTMTTSNIDEDIPTNGTAQNEEHAAISGLINAMTGQEAINNPTCVVIADCTAMHNTPSGNVSSGQAANETNNCVSNDQCVPSGDVHMTNVHNTCAHNTGYNASSYTSEYFNGPCGSCCNEPHQQRQQQYPQDPGRGMEDDIVGGGFVGAVDDANGSHSDSEDSGQADVSDREDVT